jgi:hypothetical protein
LGGLWRNFSPFAADQKDPAGLEKVAQPVEMAYAYKNQFHIEQVDAMIASPYKTIFNPE